MNKKLKVGTTGLTYAGILIPKCKYTDPNHKIGEDYLPASFENALAVTGKKKLTKIEQTMLELMHTDVRYEMYKDAKGDLGFKLKR